MAWIKRNLFFVLSVVAGLILTGYCGWLFAGDLRANAAVDKDFQENVARYNQLLLKANPYPSADNIARAKADQNQVKDFEAEVRKACSASPPPPKVDEKGFSAYLEDTIFELKVKATNAAVSLPDDMAFGFTDWRSKLSYPLGNLQPWMQQLMEIRFLCEVLFDAKINSVATFRRVSVSTNDVFLTTTDTFPASMVTNAMETITPYKIEFRCFTRELAGVIRGLAQSSNCFVVKCIVVKPAGMTFAEPNLPAPPPVVEAPARGPAAAPGRAPAPPPPPVRTRFGAAPAPAPAAAGGQTAYERAAAARIARSAAAQGGSPTAAAPVASRPVAAPATALATAPPKTVLHEQLLFITLSVDAVRFK
jgi:hypothetical protein